MLTDVHHQQSVNQTAATTLAARRVTTAHAALVAGVWVITSAILPGCGSSSNAPPESSQPNAAATDAPAVPTAGVQVSPDTISAGQPNSTNDVNRPRRQNERWTDSEGREYLGNVPLDVFFDEPYAIASEQQSLPKPTIADTSSSTAQSPDSTSTTPAPSTVPQSDERPENGATNWSATIPIDVLTSEITEVRNFLNGSLQSVSKYNPSMLMIPPRAATAAVLAEIARQHSESVTWKADAPYIRDLAKRMNENPLRRGRADQSRLLLLFENMTDTFNRSRPADLEPPPDSDTFADVAEMRLVMMRMADAEQRLKTEAGTESLFRDKAAFIEHEAALLQTMTHVVTTDGYGYEDDEEFRGYATTLINAAMSVRKAATDNDFPSYEAALTQISQACNQCHADFKNN